MSNKTNYNVPFFLGDVDSAMGGRCSHVCLDDGAKALQDKLHHFTATLDMRGVSAGDQGMELRQNKE